MPSKRNTHQQNLKQSKRLSPISTDTALFTSTIFAFLSASHPLTFLGAFSPLTTKVQEKNESSEDISKVAFEAMKPSIEKQLALACDMAAHLLASVLFLEKIYKRLNLQDPKHIVTIIYCLVRLAKDQKEFVEIKKMAISTAGKNWVWPLVWEIALTSEVVKRRWSLEEANGRLNLLDWADECQKFANNYWRSKQTEFKKVKSQKAKMISSLSKTLGLSDTATPQNA